MFRTQNLCPGSKNVFDSGQKHFSFPSSKICFRNTCFPTLDARGFSLLERRNTTKRREKPLVQPVELFENAGPM